MNAARRGGFFLAGFLALLLGACSQPKADEALHGFFQALGKGNVQQAWDGAAFGFQAQQSFKSFEANARDLGLLKGVTVSIVESDIKDKEARFKGKLTTATDGDIQFEATLIRESGAWKIFELKAPVDAGVAGTGNRFSLVGRSVSLGEGVHRDVPPEPELKKLLLDWLLKFDEAVIAGDFTKFYETLSPKWKVQVSPTRLKRAFQPFIDQNVRMAVIQTLDPVFVEKPTINSDGILILRGYYPTTPMILHFELQFDFQFPKWRLFGITLNLEASPSQPVPSASS